jgi:hypothetical protein
MPPVKPMLAKSVPDVPDGPGFLYEPKWDGFRCIVFRDGDEVELGSRNEKPLTRYFPDVVEAVKAQLPERCVVDGEIVIAGERGSTSRRCCSASTRPTRGCGCSPRRPRRLRRLRPARAGRGVAAEQPQSERRARLEQALSSSAAPVHLTPVTDDAALARSGSRCSRGPGWTASSPSRSACRTRRTSGPC